MTFSNRQHATQCDGECRSPQRSRTRVGHIAPRPWREGLILLALIWGSASPTPWESCAVGVQILAGDGSGNTEPSTVDDPGFRNVGLRGGSSGVYIGDRWVLTAGHVPAGDMVFDGVRYPWLPDTDVLIENEGDLTQFADLRMFRLAEAPPLPALRLSRLPPEAGMDVVMAGNGKSRAAEETAWQVRGPVQEPTWTEVSLDAEFDESGFKWLNENTIRWGTNQVADESSADQDPLILINTGFADTISVSTIFNGIPDSFEAQAATNDSGGALFLRRHGEWELAGIMHSIGVLPGQPTQTTVFGNRTYSASLSAYRAQIDFQILKSATDLNADGIVDAFEAGVLFGAWGGQQPEVDFTQDGIVDAADAGVLFSFWSGNSGTNLEDAVDLNNDGLVDAFDAGILFQGWGTSQTDIDFTRDGIVDAADAGALFSFWSHDTGSTLEEAVDLNDDGLVDAFDAGILFQSWGTIPSDVDFTGDGIADAADAGVLFSIWSNATTPVNGAARSPLAADRFPAMPILTEMPRILVKPIPEPNGWAWPACAGLAFLRRPIRRVESTHVNRSSGH